MSGFGGFGVEGLGVWGFREAPPEAFGSQNNPIHGFEALGFGFSAWGLGIISISTPGSDLRLAVYSDAA